MTVALATAIIVTAIALMGGSDSSAQGEGGETAAGTSLAQRVEELSRRLAQLEGVREQGAPEQFAFDRPVSFEPRKLLSTRGAEGGVDPLDNDGDQLSDAEEIQFGTDPANPDTDGDGLWDGWEVHEVNGIDLAALGASPLHKDVFVEMDYMRREDAANGLGPSPAVLDAIRQAFRDSGVANPDGSTGINIHLELGNEVSYDADLNPVVAEFNAIKADNFDPRRAPVFHYMLWAEGWGGSTSSGRSMGIPASDFIVTLGRWNGGAGGTNAQKIGTFIHEIGHNFGLRHGSGDNVGYKPNHLSVMNYLHQMEGVWRGGDRFHDFQRFALPQLDEALLDEPDGIGANILLAQYRAKYLLGGSTLEVGAEAPIDWDADGEIKTGLSLDLNNDTLTSPPLSSTLDEWNNLIFTGGSIGSDATLEGALEAAERAAERPQPFVELTEEMFMTLSVRGGDNR